MDIETDQRFSGFIEIQLKIDWLFGNFDQNTLMILYREYPRQFRELELALSNWQDQYLRDQNQKRETKGRWDITLAENGSYQTSFLLGTLLLHAKVNSRREYA